MRRLIAILALCLFAGDGVAEEEKPLAGLRAIAGQSATVRRAGCGGRLYLGDYTVSGSDAGFAWADEAFLAELRELAHTQCSRKALASHYRGMASRTCRTQIEPPDPTAKAKAAG